MWKKLVLALSALIVADVIGAQILRAVLPGWESFRVRSEIYNHDFAKMADEVGIWGPFRYRMRTNSLGFKDEANRLVPLDHRRVVLIGDSFTEGIGYEFGKTFAGILAKELAEDDVEVLNAGDRLASVLRKHLIDLTIVVYPWPDQVALHDVESKQVTYWREWAKKSDARFVNLFPPFFEGDRNEVLTRYFLPGDMHFNEAGNQLIASEFLERCDLTGKSNKKE